MELLTLHWLEWLSYALTGVVAGILAGLLGVGGGLFIVPVLLLLWPVVGVETPLLLPMAIATSLATIVMTSISSVRAHHRKGSVQWNKFWWLAPTIMVGALSGAFIVDWMPVTALGWFFGIAVTCIGIQMLAGKSTHTSDKEPLKFHYRVAGLFIGVISALIGIGGGSMTVPLLHYWKTPMVKAVATSTACGLPIAIAATAGFMVSGWQNTLLPRYSTGYVYWPAALGIMVCSVLFAPVGANLAHRLNAVVLKKFFALFLISVGIKVLLGQ